MKKLLIALCLLSPIVHAEQPLLLPIVSIYDGDTIKTELPLPAPLNKMSIRIRHIDTPEMPAASYATTGKLGRAQCVQEALRALASKQIVSSLAGEYQLMTITNYEYGKYGGRIVGDVKIGNVDIATHLIENGYAVKYEGGTKTKDWCK